MKFFEYCFYRIHSWYVYKKIDSSPRVYSTNWVSVCQVIIVFFLLGFFSHLANIKYYIELLVLLHIVIYAINYFLLTEKKYLKLEEKYKYETHKKLKGWGVFFFIIVLLILFALTFQWLPVDSLFFKL